MSDEKNKVFNSLTCNSDILESIRKHYPAILAMDNYPISYIDFSSHKGCLRYLDYERYQRYLNEGCSIRSLSYRGKIGKTIVKLVGGENIMPHVVQDIVSEIKKYVTDKTFAVESDVKSVYCDYDHSEGGNLGSSCMNGCGCTYFYNIFGERYAADKTYTKVLTLTDTNGILCGRAILWYNIPTESGYINFMDRIYVGDHNDTALFIDWARDNGFHRKKEQSYCYKVQFVRPDDTVYEAYYDIPVKNVLELIREVPYMDTFTFIDGGMLTNNYEDSNGVIFLDNTNGTGYVEGGCECHECGTFIGLDDDDAFTCPVTGVNLCESCYDEAIDTSSSCNHCGGCYWDNDMTELSDGEYYCADCVESLTTTCEICDEPIFNAEAIVLSDGSSVCEECLDGVSTCSKCGWTSTVERLFVNLDGNKLCMNCLEDAGYFVCKICKTIHKNSNCSERVGVCLHCFGKFNFTIHSECVLCHTIIPKTKALLTTAHEIVCPSCVHDNNLSTCGITGAIVGPNHNCIEGCSRYGCSNRR